MKRVAIAFAALLTCAFAYLAAALFGLLGNPERDGVISAEPRPAQLVARRAAGQERAVRGVSAPRESQILFGDLHVHTTYSMDAFAVSLPLVQGEGAHPPADACDFARHCSALDFYSLNDHAEGLTPAKWRETRESIRQCNAVAGDPADPDLVAFLGWEWTQMADAPEAHYGHKNVIFRDTEDERTPTRPIAAAGNAYTAMRDWRTNRPLLGVALVDFPNRQRYFDMLTFRAAVTDVPLCPAGVPVRDLPDDCSEAAATPRELFDKLDDWGFASLVIPHGNAWGNTTPAGIDWEKQLADGQHDPARQKLVEVYSGHGSSEEFRAWRHVVSGSNGEPVCPETRPGFEPECRRAGEIIRERCLAAGLSAEVCDERAATARRHFVEAGRVGARTVPGVVAGDWLAAGQCTDCFEPAYLYRPGGSTQHALALTGEDSREGGEDSNARFRFGLIASSDNHTARAATGYKEFRAVGMTDALDAEGGEALRSLLPLDREPRPESVAIDPAQVPVTPGIAERLGSFYYTGGLVAVHAEGRDRGAIWSALERREVYGTSGPRILLWFDVLNGPGGAVHPMGSAVEMTEAPRFRVRAVGSRVQRPGCPDYVSDALGPDRLAALCMGECHNPGDARRRIERIEVVRIRPRVTRSERVAGLIQDPWLILACPPDETGCVVEFEDEEFAASGRDAVYYVRALEEPSDQVNADNLRCEFDESGACVATRPCRPGGADAEDECVAPARARAWSSPIFVDRGA